MSILDRAIDAQVNEFRARDFHDGKPHLTYWEYHDMAEAHINGLSNVALLELIDSLIGEAA